MKLSEVDWRTLRAHLDWSLLRQRSRWLWVAGCAVTLLSFLGGWTVAWNSTISVGDYYTSGYSYTAYNSSGGDNGFTTGGFLLPTVLVAIALAYAALRPYAGAPAWLRWVPWGVVAGMGVVLAYWSVRAMVDAGEMIEAYSGTNTSFPGGVGLLFVATVLLVFGARRLGRDQRDGVAVTTTLDR